ncbi:hypothetical protein FH972_024641 [Carpinus fangiana]|uniref:Alpha/beta hydrolase fold-3 domain-containing protein n=1 Tax=Carpinus fangiana TaxID=176857 RepID=A0A5N6KYK4_9ROSI|nr:hypothetical protein FH972_024641 [Carpinus fangiana]
MSGPAVWRAAGRNPQPASRAVVKWRGGGGGGGGGRRAPVPAWIAVVEARRWTYQGGRGAGAACEGSQKRFKLASSGLLGTPPCTRDLAGACGVPAPPAFLGVYLLECELIYSPPASPYLHVRVFAEGQRDGPAHDCPSEPDGGVACLLVVVAAGQLSTSTWPGMAFHSPGRRLIFGVQVSTLSSVALSFGEHAHWCIKGTGTQLGSYWRAYSCLVVPVGRDQRIKHYPGDSRHYLSFCGWANHKASARSPCPPLVTTSSIKKWCRRVPCAIARSIPSTVPVMPSSIPTKPEAILALGDIDPELERFQAVFPMPEFDYDNPEEAISTLRSLLSQPRQLDPKVHEHNVPGFIKARDGRDLDLYVFQPATPPTGKLPLVVLFHGGGYTIGAPHNVADPARSLVLSPTNPCIVVAPQYRLAPEHPFPAALLDAFDAVTHLSNEFVAQGHEAFARDTLKLTPGTAVELDEKQGGAFIVGGISAGASISSILSHLVRDAGRGLPLPITGLWIGCGSPLPVEELVPDEYKARWLSKTQPECLDDILLPTALAKIFYDSYKPDFYSPAFAAFIWPDIGETFSIPGFGEVTVGASDEDGKKLPPTADRKSGHCDLPRTYLQVCGRDRNRDDALVYAAEISRKAGVPTRVDIYPGLPHCFWGLFKMVSAYKVWQADTQAGFAWLLKRGPHADDPLGGSREDDG